MSTNSGPWNMGAPTAVLIGLPLIVVGIGAAVFIREIVLLAMLGMATFPLGAWLDRRERRLADDRKHVSPTRVRDYGTVHLHTCVVEFDDGRRERVEASSRGELEARVLALGAERKALPRADR